MRSMVVGAALALHLEHPSIATALAALEASPLSRKKAMLLTLLIDAAIELPGVLVRVHPVAPRFSVPQATSVG